MNLTKLQKTYLRLALDHPLVQGRGIRNWSGGGSILTNGAGIVVNGYSNPASFLKSRGLLEPTTIEGPRGPLTAYRLTAAGRTVAEKLVQAA